MFTPENFIEIMSRKEELNPELKQYYEEGEMFNMIRHPLIYAVPYHPTENAMLNYRLELKKKEAQQHLDDNEFASFVFTHERAWRLNAFSKICERIGNMDYWKLLGEIWIDSENIWANMKVWRLLLTAERPHRHEFMSKQDRKLLDRLPQKLTVYRGCILGQNHNGISYTLNRDKAQWFADRFKKDGSVLKKDIDKSQIFAYLGGRGEDEIIIL